MGAAHRTNTNTNKALNGRNYQSKSAFLQHPNIAQLSGYDYFKLHSIATQNNISNVKHRMQFDATQLFALGWSKWI